jgi:hypothetical protein
MVRAPPWSLRIALQMMECLLATHHLCNAILALYRVSRLLCFAAAPLLLSRYV